MTEEAQIIRKKKRRPVQPSGVAHAASPQPVPNAEPPGNEIDQLLESLRQGQARWSRVDALYELLQDVENGEKQMPLLTMIVRLPDGSSGKIDLDLNNWSEQARNDVSRALRGGLGEQWVQELGGFVSDGAKLYRNYVPAKPAVPSGG